MDHLFKQNIAWAAARVQEDPEYFKRLSGLQTPEYLWIGCADSRVPANVITGLQPGEVFVHRNVANLVNPGDLNCLAVLQFAIDVLKVKHVIVCGHYGCGGVRAALNNERHGLIDYWLHPVRDLSEANRAELDSISDPEERVNRLCELSVIEQVRQVADTPIIRDAWNRGQELTVHGWCYSLVDGLIRNLDCTRSAP
ncbi:MAG: carbonate dehydratase [Alphaproteobacteria bacterium]|nr:carbonate dehydratase [Alphaproteobacteria bacterium]MBU0797430.1 carbonate dehydratase [Alphaproteobacteria bacterium]MBU0888549.1 carbonate dehydratase [Alphaproteobacteria bacterium]MBU1813717.1 carbonate dehydratase [Alphaproteobacteria bacterium]MBU2091556.1 carbonate dehydratase [Alphaproteobacteria bacterium]